MEFFSLYFLLQNPKSTFFYFILNRKGIVFLLGFFPLFKFGSNQLWGFSKCPIKPKICPSYFFGGSFPLILKEGLVFLFSLKTGKSQPFFLSSSSIQPS